jgi:protein-tyrosine phosphatase
MDAFRIVFLCTGNRARSPMAERCFRAAAEVIPVEVSSCGVLDLESAGAIPEAVTAARAFGIDLSDHRSRSFTAADLADADLVVGFEQHHVATAVVDGGARPERAFVLRELVHLLVDAPDPDVASPVARARSMVAYAHSRRASNDRFVPGQEMDDPIGRDQAFFERTAQEIFDMCGLLVSQLFGAAAEHRDATRSEKVEDVGRKRADEWNAIWGS